MIWIFGVPREVGLVGDDAADLGVAEDVDALAESVELNGHRVRVIEIRSYLKDK